MSFLNELVEWGRTVLPLIFSLAAYGVVVVLVLRVLTRWQTRKARPPFVVQIARLVALLILPLVVILSAPVEDTTQGQLFNFYGILVTAVVALSSTTLIGNAMAGVMLRAVRNFSAGDYLSVEGHFGRVSERGLFHTEIQTETRDLTTLPNVFLVSKPVTVIKASGASAATMTAVELSLGYDADRAEVEKLLVNAAKATGLEEPFVHIVQLGDYSTTYRIAGKLRAEEGSTEPLRPLTAKARLRGAVMDVLHGAGIEIVSPTFMNTRAFEPDHTFVSKPKRFAEAAPEGPSAEDIVFDIAEEASQLENERAKITAEIEELGESMKEHRDDPERTEALSRRVEELEARALEIDTRLVDREAEE